MATCPRTHCNFEHKLLTSNRLIQLTVEQKFDIATRELDELKEEILRKKDESEKCCDNHKVSNLEWALTFILPIQLCIIKQAVMMEADIRRSDIKKAVYEFERDIVRGAINQVGLVFSYAHPELLLY